MVQEVIPQYSMRWDTYHVKQLVDVLCRNTVILELYTSAEFEESEKLLAELNLFLRGSEEAGHVEGGAFGRHDDGELKYLEVIG